MGVGIRERKPYSPDLFETLQGTLEERYHYDDALVRKDGAGASQGQWKLTKRWG